MRLFGHEARNPSLFKVSKLQNVKMFQVPRLQNVRNSFNVWLEDTGPISPKNHFMFVEDIDPIFKVFNMHQTAPSSFVGARLVGRN